MRGDAEVMMARRQILITEDDMARLKALVRPGRMSSRRDRDHLAELDRELDRAEVVAAGDVSPDVVTMHSTVRVRDLDIGTSVVYTVVFPVDADIERKRISILAPIGTALIGLSTGQSILWTTRDGHRHELSVLAVSQPAPEGDVTRGQVFSAIPAGA